MSLVPFHKEIREQHCVLFYINVRAAAHNGGYELFFGSCVDVEAMLHNSSSRSLFYLLNCAVGVNSSGFCVEIVDLQLQNWISALVHMFRTLVKFKAHKTSYVQLFGAE